MHSEPTQSPFASAAPDLLALGYSVLPVIPGAWTQHAGRGKAPGEFRSSAWQGLSKWQRFRDSTPSAFELGLYSKWPDANIGLVLGSTGRRDLHVVALDFDAKDPDDLDALLSAAPSSPMVKRGRTGETRFFLAPKTLKSKPYDGPDGRLLDLLTGFDTRQTVVPPSVHPDTLQPYVWLKGPVAASDLPVLDADDMEALEEALEQCGWERGGRAGGRVVRSAGNPVHPDDDDLWSETKAAALSNLSAWVPALDLYGCRPARGGYEAVAHWRASSSGRAMAERKLNLSIQASGIKDFGTNDTYSAIDLVMSAQDVDQSAATSWLRERLGLDDSGVVIDLSGMALGQSEGHSDDDDLPEPLRVKGVGLNDPPAGSAKEITAKAPPRLDLRAAGRPEELSSSALAPKLPDLAVIEPKKPATIGFEGGAQPGPADSTGPADSELPDHLTRVPGLLGITTNWIADSARKPQRAGALLSAIELVGTAAGRKYAGPTLTGTHIYGLFLAPSGAAKDHPLKCIGRVLHAATMAQHFGPSGFMSMSALINRITRQPLTLTCIDEFGAFLGRINGRKASTHEKAITGVLRTAWGSSFDTMAPPEWAGRVGEPIHSPALSIYGVSTHEEFFQNLEGGDVFNGFLNRFLIFSTQQRVAEREPLADKMEVPAAIVDGMISIYTAGNPLARASSHNAQSDAPMIVVPWEGGTGGTAHRAYQALGQRIERMETDGVFFTRTAEMAQRLATIRAIGIDPQHPRITLADIDWGVEVAMWSARSTIAMAGDYMHASEHEQQSKMVQGIIEKAGTLARTDLVRRVYGQLDGRKLDMIVKMLVDGDMIQELKITPAMGGRPKTVYRAGAAA